MTLSFDYQIYTIVLFLFPFGCFLLIFMQLLSHWLFGHDSHENVNGNSDKMKATTYLLYMVYVSATGCGLVGFSLHVSKSSAWCEEYGLLPCFCFLGLSKAILYTFFLRRAEAVTHSMSRQKRKFFRYYAPVYLFSYWILYCVLTYIVFAGKIVDDQISNCVFARGDWIFSAFASCVDVFNATASLALFVTPLQNALKMAEINHLNESDHQKYLDHLGFVSVMKWNIVLTAIAAVSSVAALCCFYIVGEYIWFFCLGDPFINSLCCFLMLVPNRKFMKMILFCKCATVKRTKSGEQCQKYILEIDGVIITPYADDNKTSVQSPGTSSELALSDSGAKSQKSDI